MFGVDFFPLSDSSNAKDADDTTKDGWKDLSIRQGMGEAKMGSYVVYGALLDPAAAAHNEPIDNKSGSGDKDHETPRRNSLANLLKTKSTQLLMSHSVSNLSLGGSLKTLRLTSDQHRAGAAHGAHQRAGKHSA